MNREKLRNGAGGPMRFHRFPAVSVPPFLFGLPQVTSIAANPPLARASCSAGGAPAQAAAVAMATASGMRAASSGLSWSDQVSMSRGSAATMTSSGWWPSRRACRSTLAQPAVHGVGDHLGLDGARRDPAPGSSGDRWRKGRSGRAGRRPRSWPRSPAWRRRPARAPAGPAIGAAS
jgi:hypothetical protein